VILHEQQCVVVVQHLAVASKKTQLTYEYLIEKKRLCEAENQRLAILQPLAQLANGVFLFLHICAFFPTAKIAQQCATS
jgi:hypothetical protein